jgi:hypothetical protein
MNNNTINSKDKGVGTESNNPQSNSKLPGTDELKDYGKKSLAPLIDLVSKYKGEANPYFSAISKGLKAAVDVYKVEVGVNTNTDTIAKEVEGVVGNWFQETNDWLEGINKKIQSGNTRELLEYLEEQAKKHPAMMFSVSYVAGLLFGRIGRHIGKQYTKESTSSYDQSDLGSDSLKH